MGEDYDVDLAVIGSGGAAMSAAIAASQAGKSVVLIERGVLGGTCVNSGCVPTRVIRSGAVPGRTARSNCTATTISIGTTKARPRPAPTPKTP